MKYLYIIAGLIALALFLFLFSGSAAATDLEGLQQEEAVLYKSPTCGCCAIYGRHLTRNGMELRVVETDAEQYTAKAGVPASMRSCHITMVDGYYIEGHVPVQAVAKLLKEHPDIAGIAMPGMPSGSPGMPGSKSGDFVVYAIGHDGNIEEFTRL